MNMHLFRNERKTEKSINLTQFEIVTMDGPNRGPTLLEDMQRTR